MVALVPEAPPASRRRVLYQGLRFIVTDLKPSAPGAKAIPLPRSSWSDATRPSCRAAAAETRLLRADAPSRQQLDRQVRCATAAALGGAVTAFLAQRELTSSTTRAATSRRWAGRRRDEAARGEREGRRRQPRRQEEWRRPVPHLLAARTQHRGRQRTARGSISSSLAARASATHFPDGDIKRKQPASSAQSSTGRTSSRATEEPARRQIYTATSRRPRLQSGCRSSDLPSSCSPPPPPPRLLPPSVRRRSLVCALRHRRVLGRPSRRSSGSACGASSARFIDFGSADLRRRGGARAQGARAPSAARSRSAAPPSTSSSARRVDVRSLPSGGSTSTSRAPSSATTYGVRISVVSCAARSRWAPPSTAALVAVAVGRVGCSRPPQLGQERQGGRPRRSKGLVTRRRTSDALLKMRKEATAPPPPRPPTPTTMVVAATRRWKTPRSASATTRSGASSKRAAGSRITRRANGSVARRRSRRRPSTWTPPRPSPTRLRRRATARRRRRRGARGGGQRRVDKTLKDPEAALESLLRRLRAMSARRCPACRSTRSSRAVAGARVSRDDRPQQSTPHDRRQDGARGEGGQHGREERVPLR